MVPGFYAVLEVSLDASWLSNVWISYLHILLIQILTSTINSTLWALFSVMPPALQLRFQLIEASRRFTSKRGFLILNLSNTYKPPNELMSEVVTSLSLEHFVLNMHLTQMRQTGKWMGSCIFKPEFSSFFSPLFLFMLLSYSTSQTQPSTPHYSYYPLPNFSSPRDQLLFHFLPEMSRSPRVINWTRHNTMQED